MSMGTALIKMVSPQMDLAILATSYLVANVLIAIVFGPGASMASAILSVAAFDFFFVPPHFTFTVVDARYWVIFSVMFVVILLTSRLTLQSRKNAQEALQAEVKAEREKLISSFMSSMSHDLKTPLTYIAGAASTLLEKEAKVSPEDRRDLLVTINEESTRLNLFVEKILQLTKIESGNIRVRKEETPLEEVVGSALNRFEHFFVDREIVTEIQPNLIVPLDPLLIEQVLSNLLENAVRHTPLGSPILVRASRLGKWALVEVLDRGSGIRLEGTKKIFDKFYQTNQRGLGSGLGLAICNGIVKAHQGRIGVKSRVGGGSIFFFHFL